MIIRSSDIATTPCDNEQSHNHIAAHGGPQNDSLADDDKVKSCEIQKAAIRTSDIVTTPCDNEQSQDHIEAHDGPQNDSRADEEIQNEIIEIIRYSQ